LKYQWSLNSVPITGATNTSLSLTNVHLPGCTISVAVTNFYGGFTSSVPLIVQDTLAPVITVTGTSPFYVELGGTYADPGATANDLCAGAVGVTASGAVNPNAVGTNTVTYTANDGNGNTSSATRTVIVRDTTPPTILWSFTNLVLAANSNCVAEMPAVTGTNFLLAADLSGVAMIVQSPTNGTVLFIGTNYVVLAVADPFTNTAYVTNWVIVQDQTAPVIWSQPQSLTNLVGTVAGLSVAATACTPLTYQWFFNRAALAAQSNATLMLSNLTPAAAGNYFVTATASGGASTSAVATLTVNLQTTAVALTSSKNPSGFKDSVNFTAAVTPTNATGFVQFLTNSAAFDSETLVAGQAVSTNLAMLPRGTNVVTAVYSGDANDLPATNLLSQIVTNHPPVAVAAFYTNVFAAPLAIPIPGLAAGWSDVDGDVVSLAAVSASTNGITLTNTGTALIYFNAGNVADQFTCTTTDGWGGTNFQTMFIVPATPPNTTPLISSVVTTSNGVILSLGGASGSTYVLESTGDLFPPGGWQPIATNTLGTNGVWQFDDPQATNFPQRFYRLKLAP
jgi:hypothetical protein